MKLVKYLSQEWLDLGKKAVNENEEFRKLAKGMNLTINHVITDVPQRGTVCFWSTFGDGECIEVKIGKKSDANFTLIGSFDVWKQIHSGSTELVQMVLEKKLQVEGKPIKGIKILKMAPLMNEIIAAIDTDFDI